MVARGDSPQLHDVFAVWADALSSDPLAAVSDILEGRGSRGALQLAEPGDFLADLLAQPSLLLHRDALTQAIDGALTEWMEQRFVWAPARVAQFGTRAYVAQFADALAAVARLPLASCPTRLVEQLDRWDARFRSMRWPNDIDLLRQFDVALAQHQHDERLASRWFASCEEAAWAGPYWRECLGTGLLGLRKIPDPTATQPERLVATALLRFAALSSQRRTDSSELRAEFQRHVSTLGALYPRHHSRWKETWASALASLRGLRQHRSVAQDDWLRPSLPSQCFPELDSGRNEPAKRNWTQPGRRPAYLPPRAELDAVTLVLEETQTLDHPLWRKVHTLITRHWEYARYTHQSYYAVRTTHNLCDRLLRKHPSQVQLADVSGWTLQALQADSGNAHVWDLWAKVLAASGAQETSLDVRWETVRRFPDNLVVRIAMIVALANQGRRELAGHLFDETWRDFPNEAIKPRLLRAIQRLEGAASEMSHPTDDPLAVQLHRIILDEQFFCEFGGEHSAVVPDVELQGTYSLASLRGNTTLLRHYFTRRRGLNATPIYGDWPLVRSPTSELEFVVAWCTKSVPGLGTEVLDSWMLARPASYSVRLLALARGITGHGPDPEEFSELQSAFPQHRHWNKWLGYAFAGPYERTRLRQQARDEGLWAGRLSAVYPDLDVPHSRAATPMSEPLRRLVQDVALANADVGPAVMV